MSAAKSRVTSGAFVQGAAKVVSIQGVNSEYCQRRLDICVRDFPLLVVCYIMHHTSRVTTLRLLVVDKSKCVTKCE
jgi:hypothetical protein